MVNPVSVLVAVFLTGSLAVTPAQSQNSSQAQLWDASIAGDTVAIARALDAGANVDALDTRTNRNGRRALNWAAFHDRGPAVKLLIARGANLNLTNLTGFTPVHHAAEAGAADAMAILLEAGADITIANQQGMLPIDTARTNGHTLVAQLLEAAAKKP